MKLSELGVSKPVTTTMVFFAILVLYFDSPAMSPAGAPLSPTASAFPTLDPADDQVCSAPGV